MIIEIFGTGFSNKGAELMLAAIVERLSRTIPDAQFAVEPWVGPYQHRARYGLVQRFDANNSGRLGWIREKLFHKDYQRRFGLVTERDVAAILDASGFALGDAWPEAWAHSKAGIFARWRSQGKKIVLLPQAMGPFQRESTRKSYKEILEAADLVFARDQASLSHAKGLCPEHPGLRLAPDFTTLTNGMTTQMLGDQQCAAIIPNAMMIRDKPRDDQAAYVSFLAQCANHLGRVGLKPFILLYETEVDRDLADEVRGNIAGDVRVLAEENAVRLKGVTGEFQFTVSSRFHGLVNALGQGVPSIGTAWSHKYQALFEEYERPNWLIEPSTDSRVANDLITQILDDRVAHKTHLLGCADRIKDEAEAMWQAVESALKQ